MTTPNSFNHALESTAGIYPGNEADGVQADSNEGFSDVHAPTPTLEEAAAYQESRWQWLQWLRRQQLKIAIGGVAVSTALTFTNEFDKFEHQIIETGPWVGSIIGGAEIVWIGSAAVMLASIGSKIGNPLKLRGRVPEIVEKAVDSRTFKAGFATNITASMLQTGVAVEAITQLPPETLGYLGIPAWNLGTDLLLINMVRKGIKKNSAAKQHDLIKNEVQEAIKPNHESDRQSQVCVREANMADVERLAEIDLSRYKRVYGQNPPPKEEVMNMFSRCITNAGPGWTYVCEVDGEVEGLVNAFRTNKTMDEFVSWEDCTADGTLDDRVDPDGKFVYIANLTVNPKATKLGGEDMLVANLMSQGIQEGIEYGYFISRMPIFSAWVKRQIRQGKISPEISPEALDDLAVQYANSKELVDDKEVRIDYELRMYEEFGFQMGRVVRNGFQDPPSMSYGVLFKADVPPKGVMKKSKLVRYGMANGLRFMARHPKLLAKTFAS